MRFYLVAMLCCAASTIALGAATGGGKEPTERAAATAATARPEVAAPPAWVTPGAPGREPAAARGGATVDLLNDTQVRLTSDSISSYRNFIYRIDTSQGLSSGAIQVGWDPALETLTFHHVRLLRGGKTIDLLHDGSSITVARREPNLERASLDGELTAILQPEDLRVGDTVDVAYSRTRRDPAMAGHANLVMGPEDGASYGRTRIRILWPSSRKVNWRALPGIVKPVIRTVGDEKELVSDLNSVTTQKPPVGAPSRFMIVNSVELSDFAEWTDVSQTLEPFYAKAARIEPGSPLLAEASRIANSSADPKVRAEKALILVETQVRYLFLGMDDGGYIPAAADLTWARRFGDCKAKTVLLLALLKELGIEARPVLVNTDNGDGIADRLPAMSAFNHVIVEATIEGRNYWLDGTQLGDRSLADLRTPNYRFGLPIVSGRSQLVPLVPEPLNGPTEIVSVSLDATAGLDVPAPAKAEMRFKGNSAIDMRLKYADLSEAELDDELRGLWRKNLDFITPQTVAATDDPATGDFVVTMTGTAKMEWFKDAGARWYEVDGARLGWKFDVVRDGQLNADAPFAFDYPDWWAKRETIKLPGSGRGFKLQGGSIDEKVGGLYSFHRKVSIDGDTLTMEANTQALAAELPAAKAAATRTRMAELSASGVYVRVPDDYLATEGDIRALNDDKPAQAKALMQRGAIHFDRGEMEMARADETAALALDPGLAVAHGVLALVMANRGEDAADREADKALAIDDKLWLAWNAKGSLALSREKFADAENYFTKSIAAASDNGRAFAGRAGARVGLGKFADSLADVDAALRLEPDLPLRAVRAADLAGLGRDEEALAEFDRLSGSDLKNRAIRRLRAHLRDSLGKTDGAREDIDALIAEKPEVDLYLDRAGLWPAADRAKARADVDAALKLDPRSTKALAARAAYSIQGGDLDKADDDIAKIAKLDPKLRGIAALRAEVLIKRGKPIEAVQVIDGMVAQYGDATALNERCWTKATLNVEVDSALDDCEKALKLSPDSPAILDSRAFAKLRLGSIDGAIDDYTAALKLAPHLPASLFGRGIAKARKGDRAGALADLAAARKLAPEIDARFADYGVTPPAGLTAQ